MANVVSGRGGLFLIDTPGFIFRAYHALPSLSTATGEPTGAVYGFCNMLLRLLDDHQPTHVAAVFDSGRASTFRREIYPEYKANRPEPPDDLKSQFPLVIEILSGFRIPTLQLPFFEADDIIATLAKWGREAGMPVTVVSSDKDLMQLADESIQLLDTMKDRVFDREGVFEKFGVYPEQLGDYLALVGDSSDNVPGVPGVGPKTATKLLTEHGDLETVLAAAEKVKGKKLSQNLKEHGEAARLSRRLVELRTDCPLDLTLEDLARQDPDSTFLWRRFGELEFGRLRPRIASPKERDRSAYTCIKNRAQLEAVVAEIRQSGKLALWVEPTSRQPAHAALVGLALSWAEQKACYLPLSHVYLGAPQQLPLGELAEVLGPILTDERIEKVTHDSKLLFGLCARFELPISGIDCDTLLCSYLIDPSRAAHDLPTLVLDELGWTMLARSAVIGKSPIDESMVETAAPLCAERADATLALAAVYKERLAQSEKLAWLDREVERPLSRVLAKMELAGCLICVDILRQLSSELSRSLETLQADVQQQAGWAVNINSPKQLQKLLFEQLGLSTGRKTKTGFSTDSDVLADLALEHPIAAQIEEYRVLSKLRSTYLDALPSLVNRRTGRVHTSYNQAVTATGRLSSSDPNLQNIPIRTDIGRSIRAAFVPKEGRVLLSADYSQIELRILAHLSEDPVLVDAFVSEQDVHVRTAAEVFGVDPKDVSADQRRVAKAVNFGVVYGQTDWGLAKQLRISKAEAGRYIEGYFERYAGVKAFMEETIATAKTERVVRTLLGRRRPLPDINSRRYAARNYAERIARNTPIQGTAADLMKVAMIRVDRALQASDLDISMILTVHDELVFEVEPAVCERAAELIREAMVSVHQLAVPLKVDIAWGASWAEAH
jgi:DNA polymerase-1